mmetsp:Transcript_17629/g.21708  ORF Transcript_17629/g.21708 Transcript_17629/m.21708 type:complete len:440 (-) Transcript_17629:219-1538(-)
MVFDIQAETQVSKMENLNSFLDGLTSPKNPDFNFGDDIFKDLDHDDLSSLDDISETYSNDGSNSKKRPRSKGDTTKHSVKKIKKDEQKDQYLPWTSSEDKKMVKLVEQMKAQEEKRRARLAKKNKSAGIETEAKGPIVITWVKIAKKMPGRTSKQCRERWRNKLNPNIKRELWTVKEDLILLDAHKKLGNRWVKLASMLPGRTENSVKTRFKSITRAMKRMWRADEDSKVTQLYNEMGSRWLEIAAQLPGRTPNGVKMRCRHLLSRHAGKSPEPGAPEQAIVHLYKVKRTASETQMQPIPNVDNIKPSKPVEYASVQPVVSDKFVFSESTKDISIRENLEKTEPTKPLKKKGKGTRALIFDELQKSPLDTTHQSFAKGNFANTIASILGNSTDIVADIKPIATSQVNPTKCEYSSIKPESAKPLPQPLFTFSCNTAKVA